MPISALFSALCLALAGCYGTQIYPALQEQLNSQIQTRFAEVLPFIPLMSPGGNFAYRPQAYDHWVYVKGTGIMTAWSFLPPEALNP